MYRISKTPPWILSMLFASSVLASCTTGAGSDVASEQHQIGHYANLSATEWQTYRADAKYVRRLVGPNTPIHLNMADPRQYRFALARVKISGKTPVNAPYLFESLERTRKDHVRRGYGPGLRPDAVYQTMSGGDRDVQHFISAAGVGDTSGAGAASSTYPSGSYYTYLDVGYYDGADVPLGSPNIVEQFGGGTDVNVEIAANLASTSLDSFVVDTFKLEDSAGGFDSSYVYDDVGLQSAQPAQRPTRPEIVVDSISDPVERVHMNDVISICLNRTWTQDCDYDLTGDWAAVKVPLQGSLRIESNHIFDQNAIDQIRSDLENGIPNPRAGYIKLVLANDGGGCDVKADGALHSDMEVFWDNVTLSADKKLLSWNLTGANSAFFDDGCRLVQDLVKLTMRLQLPVHDPDNDLDYYVSQTLTSDPDQFAPDWRYDPITMVNSCLAAGTRIQMADGSQVPIEQIAAGDRVFNSFHGGAQALTVTDTATGVETVPMVRLAAASGHTVLMTEMHPVQTPDRGIVLAKDLAQGDQVITASGASKLTSVTREQFDGKVYNVKLGTEAEQAAIGVDQTLVYADGFLVGDGQIQSKYESIAMAARRDGDVLERLPAQWHADYRESPLRK